VSSEKCKVQNRGPYLLELLVHLRTLSSHDVCEIRREYKRRAFSFYTEFLFEITQKVAKVDVEQVAGARDLSQTHAIKMMVKVEKSGRNADEIP
jgi:hypothetical protein